MARDLTTQCANSQTVSLRDQSTSKLEAAIRSPHDAGQTLERINQVLAAFYDPNLNDPKTRAGVREEFVRAMADRPQWAVHRAFDDWVRTRDRRPSPAEILILVRSHLQPIEDILRDRRKAQEAQAEEQAARKRQRCSAEAAETVMQQAGFTAERMDAVRRARTATTFAEAEEISTHETTKPHWADVADPDGPEMQALRKSRGENALVQAARGGAHDRGMDRLD